MNLSNSYFAIPNPLLLFDRWLNAYSHQRFVVLNEKNIEVNWTKRAEDALNVRQEPLTIEMQLYFSCVVKKRVIFHDHANFECAVAVTDKLHLCYRALQSAACDPETFARDYPQQCLLESKAARNMQPSKLNIDFSNGQWQGEIGFTKTRADNYPYLKAE
ncbi:MAG: hypothetical protein HKN34_01595 [Gammaproteobacteria bacterium]|nr:hypothetical protein [Gammaproteobacteria bacterium]